jgi:diacylglycerol kinase family enzyme
LHFIGIFNRDGGTFRTMDMDAFCTDAKAVFEKHGHSLECFVVAGPDLQPKLESAATDPKSDALLVGGGDGTVSAAAEIAFRHRIPLAVIPAGTMNLFAKAMSIPLDLHLALEALAAGKVQAVDIATANGQPFVHQFGVGIHARLVRTRDNMTYSSRIGKIMASIRAVGS